MEKRLSHGLQVGASYTYSHALDEQSAMGLFYNGNNPLNLRSGYGNSDFDRTHVINFNYLFNCTTSFPRIPLRVNLPTAGPLRGITVLQSGQPYSVIDYSGAVGSIFYGVSNGITNPIVPLAPGCTPQSALTGNNGTTPGLPALNADCFTVPLLAPGALNGAIPANDPYETNFTTGASAISSGSPGSGARISRCCKTTKLNERFSFKYTPSMFSTLPTRPASTFPSTTFRKIFTSTISRSTVSPCTFSPTASGLGVVNKTIGGPRQIQMTLKFLF